LFVQLQHWKKYYGIFLMFFMLSSMLCDVLLTFFLKWEYKSSYFLIKSFSVYTLWITKGWKMNQPFENSKKIHIVTRHPADILATCCHPRRLNKSNATVFKRLHLETMSCRSSSGWRHDHIRILCEANGITWKKEDCLDLLKMISLRVFHISHNKAQAPTRICTLSCVLIPCNQFPNKFVILVGGVILNVIWTTR
jgi:hypothetical protein